MALRDELIEVAARLLREQGAGAVTTRAVAAAAGVQAPAIYRLFGDKDGLLDAVAEHVFAAYVERTRADTLPDPVEDLRNGWDAYVGFGLANPALFGLFVDPAHNRESPAILAGLDVLTTRVRRIAAAGQLRVSEARALELIQAAGVGTVLVLLWSPADVRRLDLADAMYEAVLQSVLTEAAPVPASGPTAAAVAFRTVVPDLHALTDAERGLLVQWLDRATER